MSGGSYDYACHRIEDLASSIWAREEEQLARPDPEPHIYVWRPETKTRTEYKGEEAAAILAGIARHRAWFVDLLRLVATAAHDVEWVDSCDYGEGDEVQAIRAIARHLATLPPGVPELRGGEE